MNRLLRSHITRYITSLLSFSGEKPLLITKPHVYTIIVPLFFTVLSTLSLLVIAYIILLYNFSLVTVFLLSSLSIIIGGSITCGIIVLNWLIHFYIITSHKIIEMHYVPPFSHTLYTILLDQVRCTEVDTQKRGLIHEILNIGDVTITFDRPTHQEAFVLKDIADPEKKGIYLSDVLNALKTTSHVQPFWYRASQNPEQLRLSDDIQQKSLAY